MEVGVEAHELWESKDEVIDLLRPWEKNELVSEFECPCMNEIAMKGERRSEDDERYEVEDYWTNKGVFYCCLFGMFGRLWVGIYITKNTRCYNVIFITIHLFGNNTIREPWRQ